MNSIFEINSMFILIAILLYPIGLAYGWRQMYNLLARIRSTDRPPRGNIGSTTIAITIMNISLAFGITIVFGWLFGVYNAIKILVRHRA